MTKQQLSIALIIGISILLGNSFVSHADDPAWDENVIPLPQWRPPLGPPIAPPSGVEIDLRNRKRIVREISTLPTNSIHVNGNQGVADRVEMNSTVAPRSFSDLMLVNNPSASPWRQNVALQLQFHDSTGALRTGRCSGALIDSLHVLTAGHCVYQHTLETTSSMVINDFIETGLAIPAYNLKQAPYGYAKIVSAWTLTGWIDNQDANWDIGLVTLDRPIGVLVGWFGYSSNSADDFFFNRTFYNPGYPSETPYNGLSMYYWYGTFDRATAEILYHDKSAYKGQSGSAIYLRDENNNNNGIIYGVLSHRSATSVETGMTRLTPTKVEAIQGQIAAHTPDQPNLIPLQLKISPSQITASETLSIVTMIVHNYASVGWQGRALVKLYLSPDEQITITDTLLYSDIYSGTMNGKQSAFSTVPPPTLPASLEGNYWLGLTIETCGTTLSPQTTQGQDLAKLTIIRATNTPQLPRPHSIYLPIMMSSSPPKC